MVFLRSFGGISLATKKPVRASGSSVSTVKFAMCSSISNPFPVTLFLFMLAKSPGDAERFSPLEGLDVAVIARNSFGDSRNSFALGSRS